MTAYWDAQATDIESATRAVFSEDDIETHTAKDVALIADLLGALPPGPILDLGCGIGRLALGVAAATGRTVVGYDPSEPMIALAKKHNHSDLVEYDTRWPLEETFAGCYSMLVMQHLPKDTVTDYFDAVFPRLAAGGRFVVQFVTGHYHVDHDHRYPVQWMVDLGVGRGFRLVDVMRDIRHPEWRWMTFEK